jgi:serine/threonine-protein kinase HipA
MGLKEAKAIIKQIALVTATWREVATASDATQSEIHRVASAFEHSDLTRALSL